MLEELRLVADGPFQEGGLGVEDDRFFVQLAGVGGEAVCVQDEGHGGQGAFGVEEVLDESLDGDGVGDSIGDFIVDGIVILVVVVIVGVVVDGVGVVGGGWQGRGRGCARSTRRGRR